MIKQIANSIWGKLFFIGLIIILALEIFHHRHSYFAEKGLFSIDASFGFYAIFGFLMAIAIGVVVMVASTVIRKDERYHDNDF